MTKIKAVSTSVQYHDFLRLALHTNLHHFESWTVVTSLTDTKTVEVCNDFNQDGKIKCIQTNAFYEPKDAIFNKYACLNLALEPSYDGWICVIDADILLPREIKWQIKPGNLYTPFRRMHVDLDKPMPLEAKWQDLPYHKQVREFAGYLHLFHTRDKALTKKPYYCETTTCASGDSLFQAQWNDRNKVRPDWDCLHLGSGYKNWAGRTTDYLDTGKKPIDADLHKQQLKKMETQRRIHRGFKHEIIAPAGAKKEQK